MNAVSMSVDAHDDPRGLARTTIKELDKGNDVRWTIALFDNATLATINRAADLVLRKRGGSIVFDVPHPIPFDGVYTFQHHPTLFEEVPA